MATSEDDSGVSRQRLWQKKNRAKGKCVRCGGELAETSILHCPYHVEWHRLWQKGDRIKKKKEGMQ